MKALPKKRKDQLTLDSHPFREVTLAKQQLFFYSASIAVYVWFMFWIASDIFVWHKPLLEGNFVNYIGASAAVVSIWVEAKILRAKRASRKTEMQTEQVQIQKPQTKKTRVKVPQKPVIKHTQTHSVEKPKQTEISQPKQKQTHTKPVSTPSVIPKQTAHSKPSSNKCIKHAQAPKNLQNPEQIPDECLTCTNLIQCMSNKN